MKNDQSELNLLWGAAAIAAAIGRSRRAVFFMLEQGVLPAKKIGNRWVVSREALQQFFHGRPEA